MAKSGFTKAFRRALNNPTLFNALRFVLNGGRYTDKVESVLKAKKGESVIDVGCGIGDHAYLVKGNYVGIDFNPEFIRYAKRKYSRPNRKFMRMDATRMSFRRNSFDKAMYISMLHHFNDAQNMKVLREISRITRKRIIILDLVPDRHPFRKLLWKMDRGDYVRPVKRQVELISKALKIKRLIRFKTRSGSAVHSLFICEPRSKNRSA